MTARGDAELTKVTMHYGIAVLNPHFHAKIIESPPPTLMELIRCAFYELWGLAVPSFYFAVAITAFRVAFGLL